MADPRIRPIEPDDVPAVIELVYDLAEYERSREQCHLTPEQLTAALFGSSPALFGLVAMGPSTGPFPAVSSTRVPPSSLGDWTGRADQAGRSVVGYALYFLNFSTWEGVHGIYLEDLYVRPDQRGSGLGRALLTTLAGIATGRGYARVEWWVLNWNAPSIGFYESLGAVAMDDWTVFRLTGPALQRAAESG
jgi:ribosomal protein S18 acetylase RimI-like enzyme